MSRRKVILYSLDGLVIVGALSLIVLALSESDTVTLRDCIQLSTPVLLAFIGWLTLRSNNQQKQRDAEAQEREKVRDDARRREAAEAAQHAEAVRKTLKDTEAKLAEAASERAQATDAVKAALLVTADATTTKLDNLGKLGHSTHVLVNERFGRMLEAIVSDKKTIMDMSPTPESIAAYELAKQTAQNHHDRQAVVDAAPGTDAEKSGAAPSATPLEVRIVNPPDDPANVRVEPDPPADPNRPEFRHGQ